MNLSAQTVFIINSGGLIHYWLLRTFYNLLFLTIPHFYFENPETVELQKALQVWAEAPHHVGGHTAMVAGWQQRAETCTHIWVTDGLCFDSFEDVSRSHVTKSVPPEQEEPVSFIVFSAGALTQVCNTYTHMHESTQQMWVSHLEACGWY